MMSITRIGLVPIDRAPVSRRILVVNSNTSSMVTRQLADTVAPFLSPGTEATFVNPTEGPAGIDSLLDMAVAGAQTACLVARHRADFDAFVVACGNDPGLAACQEATDRPVVGIAAAGMFQACTLGARFSVAVLAESKVEPMRNLVRRYGLEGRLAGIIPVESDSASAAREPGELLAQLIGACRGQCARSLGDVLVLTGSVMGRLAAPLTREIGIPVISGLYAAIRSAEVLVDLGLKTRGVSNNASPMSNGGAV